MLTAPNKFTTPPAPPGVSRPAGWFYREEATGAEFIDITWQGIMGRIGNARLAMGLDLSFGWMDRVEDELCRQNPHLECVDSTKPEDYADDLARMGRKLWAELHAYTEAYDGDETKARQWLQSFSERVPNYSFCHCRLHWEKLGLRFPPRLESRERFVEWARISHDAINKRIGKPILYPDLLEAANIGDL